MRRWNLGAAVVTAALLAGSGVHAQPAPSSPVAASDTALTKARIDNETAQARYYAKQADKGASSGPPAWLQTLLGGFVAILGSMVTLFLTNWFTARKSKAEQVQTYARHEHQLRLAAQELRESLSQLAPDLPGWVLEDLVYEEPRRPASPSRTDRYYLKYDLVDCVYRLCALLGWLELYRTDTSFLRGPSADRQQQLERLFGQIRSDLADSLGAEKAKAGATAWRDGFILAEDQRAIGEQMLDRERSEVIGYARFCERLFCSPKREDPTGWHVEGHQNWWVWNATRFIFELNSPPTDEGGSASPTFARIRVARLTDHCAALDRLLGTPAHAG